MIEVVADRRVTVMREFAGCLSVPFVPARRVMKQHHAREGARPQRPRDIGRDRLVFVAVDRDGFRNHAFVGHGRYLLVVAGRSPGLRPVPTVMVSAGAGPGPSPATPNP